MDTQENWQEEDQAIDTQISVADPSLVVQSAELPDIKLFGKWSCDDVQVSDMSLQVRNFCFIQAQ